MQHIADHLWMASTIVQSISQYLFINGMYNAGDQYNAKKTTENNVYKWQYSFLPSGTMEPAPIGVHCLSCNEFPSSAILGQTTQLLCRPSTLYMACLVYLFRLQFRTSVLLTSCCPPSCICSQTVRVSSEQKFYLGLIV